MSNLEKYKQIFIKVFDVKEDELNANFKFGDVERWDSLAHITLITELEDTFNIMFETEDILNFGSYENGKKLLKKYGIAIEK